MGHRGGGYLCDSRVKGATVLVISVCGCRVGLLVRVVGGLKATDNIRTYYIHRLTKPASSYKSVS